MKRIIYLIILLLPLVSGCTKTESSPTVEKFDRYIFFSQVVETKANLVETLHEQTFGVVGFKYSNTYTDWASFISQNPAQTPNVFFDDNGLVNVEECLVNETQASYAPLQGWSKLKKYAFFAYYPLGDKNVTLVNLDGNTYDGGAPAIKYTMSTTDPSSSMVDVMTAQPHTKLDGNSSQVTNSDVTFNFQHCLSCLGLNIKNSSTGNITIKSVVWKPSGLINDQIIIPLDGSSSNKIAASSAFSAEESFTINKSIESNEEIELSDKLIFIPQDENITVQVEISYVREASNGYPAREATYESASLTTQLLTGKKHLIHLNFTESSVNVVRSIDEAEWVKIPNVGNSFN